MKSNETTKQTQFGYRNNDEFRTTDNYTEFFKSQSIKCSVINKLFLDTNYSMMSEYSINIKYGEDRKRRKSLFQYHESVTVMLPFRAKRCHNKLFVITTIIIYRFSHVKHGAKISLSYNLYMLIINIHAFLHLYNYIIQML